MAQTSNSQPFTNAWYHAGPRLASESIPMPDPAAKLEVADLVRAATLAPSPDNNQPWQFVAAENELDVFLDPIRALPSDVNSMFDLTALGAAIENVCIAARQLGYEAAVQVLDPAQHASSSTNQSHVAKITWKPQEGR